MSKEIFSEIDSEIKKDFERVIWALNPSLKEYSFVGIETPKNDDMNTIFHLFNELTEDSKTYMVSSELLLEILKAAQWEIEIKREK